MKKEKEKGIVTAFTVMPKRDFRIFRPMTSKGIVHDFNLKEGVEIEIPVEYKNTLKTEGVI